jgi:hypothetical protein
MKIKIYSPDTIYESLNKELQFDKEIIMLLLQPF